MKDKYEHLLKYVNTYGEAKTDRTGTGTKSVFGCQVRYNLNAGFPIVTTKKVHFKSVVAELLWFLSGSTNVKDLQVMGCTIWDEWADEDGDLGPIYGAQWRACIGQNGPIDQIARLIDGIKRDPHGRRHIVSAWSVSEIPHMALAPCHALFQFDVTGGRLSCKLYQRSADLFLGVPFNIASYALLTHMVAQQCDLDVGDFIWSGGDCHIYNNHADQVALQLSRKPFASPSLNIKRRPDSIFDYRQDDFELIDYKHHQAIPAPVAV
jgi:thymidylate synthase